MDYMINVYKWVEGDSLHVLHDTISILEATDGGQAVAVDSRGGVLVLVLIVAIVWWLYVKILDKRG